ncbi:GT-D fold domain-containing glycosyltransferase [Tatumella saanichensis]|uniref:GT-D fold domain-containing glycosyltransferase n=1 Tax=Tatumella saanichensis TaxID=480813 RepID=UPI0004BC8EF1|nr:GT-D fold domain-containing glycosyltransferase [Tatumella saanichensis]
MNVANNILRKIRFPFKFFYAAIQYLFVYKRVRKVGIRSIHETSEFLLNNPTVSLARFGDGELEMLSYKNIGFQSYDIKLSLALKNILLEVESNKNCLVCMPDGFNNTRSMNFGPALFWFFHKSFFFRKYSEYLSSEYLYGNTSVTRPYNDYKVKTQAKKTFDDFKLIIKDLNVLVVEGAGTKLGVGNDLLKQAKKVIRITTVNANAFSFYNEIFNSIVKRKSEYDIVLISLGPTATILSFELSKLGIRCFDTGHVDIEYEWMLKNAKKKIAISGKNVNEAGVISSSESIFMNKVYASQIIEHIS